jgi:hypothetical protein
MKGIGYHGGPPVGHKVCTCHYSDITKPSIDWVRSHSFSQFKPFLRWSLEVKVHNIGIRRMIQSPERPSQAQSISNRSRNEVSETRHFPSIGGGGRRLSKLRFNKDRLFMSKRGDWRERKEKSSRGREEERSCYENRGEER